MVVRTHAPLQARDEQGAPARMVRMAELRRVDDLRTLAASGRNITIAIDGVEGAGKTVLTRAALAHARRDTWTTHCVLGYSLELPWFVASRLAADLQVSDGGNLDGPPLIRAIEARLTQLDRAGRPTAICFEDVHAYHPTDLALVHELVLANRGERRFLLLTARPGAPAADELIRKFETLGGATRITLGGLSAEEALALIETMTEPGTATARFARDAVQRSRGNPARLVDLVRQVLALTPIARAEMLSGSRSLDALPAPAAVADELLRTVRALAPLERGFAHALAVWDAPATVETIARLTDQPRARVEETAIALETAGTLTSVDADGPIRMFFSDPLAAHALAREVPGLERRRLVARIAGEIEAGSEDATLQDSTWRARHYLRADQPLGAARVECVLKAARELIDHSRYATAGDLLHTLIERLRQQQQDVPPDASVLLAETLSRSGSWQNAREVLESLGGDYDAALIRRARDHVALGREEQALALYRTLLADESVPNRPRVQALLDSAWALQMLGRPREAERAARDAARVAEGIDDPALGAEAQLSMAIRRLIAAQPKQALEVARRAGRLASRSGSMHAIAYAAGTIGNALCDTGPITRGVRWMERALRHAEDRDDYPTLSGTGARLTTAYIEIGEWRRAEQIALSTMHIDASLHRIRALRRSRATLHLLHALQGSADSLDAGVDQTYRTHEDFGGPAVFVSDYVARYEHEMLNGNPARAAETIRSTHQLLSQIPGWDRLLIVDILPREAEAAAVLGEAATLKDAIAALEAARQRSSGMPVVDAQIVLARAFYAGAHGESAAAARLALEAATAFDRLDYRWREAGALQWAGTYAIQAGDADLAVSALSPAFALFDAMGARVRGDEVRELLGRLGHRPSSRKPATSSLTARERQVARLIAEGLSDAEIAARLRISRRTVTTHVHRILAKLDVRSRTAVPQRLAGTEAPAAAPPAPVRRIRAR